MFESISLTVAYKKLNRRKSVNLEDGGNADIGFAITKDEERLRIELITQGDIVLEEAILKTNFYYVPHYRVFCGTKYAGYSRETSVSPSNKKKLLRYINRATIAKVSLKKLNSISYTYIRDREKYTLIGSLDEKVAYTEFNHRPEIRTLQLRRDFGSLPIGESFFVFDLYYSTGGYDDVFDAYFKEMCPTYSPRKLLTEYDACNSDEVALTSKILNEKLEYAAEFNVKFDAFVVENYEKHTGDWLKVDDSRFDESLDLIAKSIKAKKLLPGIRLSPFSVSAQSEFAINNKALLEKDDLGITIVRKGYYHLDIDNAEARAYIKGLFAQLMEMGYEVFKISGINQIIYGKREAGKAHRIISFLRECVGNKLLIATDAPVISCAGLVDYCRVSAQLVTIWKGKIFNRVLSKHNSARNAVLNIVSRRHLDGRVYRTYPSKTYFENKQTHLNEEEKLILYVVNQFFSGGISLCDDLREYTENTKNLFLNLAGGATGHVNRIISPAKNQIEIDYTVSGTRKLFCFDQKKGKILYKI